MPLKVRCPLPSIGWEPYQLGVQIGGGEIRKVYETGDLFDTKYESVSNGKTVQKLGGSHGLAGLCVETHVLKVVSSNPSTV